MRFVKQNIFFAFKDYSSNQIICLTSSEMPVSVERLIDSVFRLPGYSPTI